jgi:hypothetical protein
VSEADLGETRPKREAEVTVEELGLRVEEKLMR